MKTVRCFFCFAVPLLLFVFIAIEFIESRICLNGFARKRNEITNVIIFRNNIYNDLKAANLTIDSLVDMLYDSVDRSNSSIRVLKRGERIYIVDFFLYSGSDSFCKVCVSYSIDSNIARIEIRDKNHFSWTGSFCNSDNHMEKLIAHTDRLLLLCSENM